MTNVATTTSPGEIIAIAVKHPRQEEAVDANAETTVVETVVVDSNVGTIVAETAEGVTTVAEIAEVVTIVAEIAEVATVEEATEVATTVAHPVENIVGAMIADPHDVIPENLADGDPKARVAPAGAEISRGAFI